MPKILTFSSFVIASLIVTATFITATTYTQLAVAILLYPLLVYFTYKAFLGKAARSSLIKTKIATQSPLKSAEIREPDKKENVGIADIDKRVFLKLIGGAGLSLFLFSIFNKKVGGLFPGIAAGAPGTTLIKDAAGNQINPAESHPTDGYIISEIDDISSITFYGFINQEGAWYIMRQTTDEGAFRYVRGDSNFPSSWTNRKNLSYDYFNSVF